MIFNAVMVLGPKKDATGFGLCVRVTARVGDALGIYGSIGCMAAIDGSAA